jgi:hypothetical protein
MCQAMTIRGGWFLLALTALSLSPVAGASDKDEFRAKIHELETQLSKKGGTFDWALHNELRHFYGAVERDKEYYHINVILKHSFMDGYMLDVISGFEAGKDKVKAAAIFRELAVAKKQFPLVAAACWARAGELEFSVPNANAERALPCFQNVLNVKGDGVAPYHRLANEVLNDKEINNHSTGQY